MLLTILSVFGLITLTLYFMVFRWKNREIRKFLEQIQFDCVELPILGHIWKLIGNGEERMEAFKEFGNAALKYGSTYYRVFNIIFVTFADVESIEYIAKNCLQKPDIAFIAWDLIGYASPFAPVHIWRGRRKMISPTFGQKVLDKNVTIFAQKSQIFIKQLEAKAGKGCFSFFDYAATYSMDALCQTSLGVNIDAQTNSNHPVAVAFNTYNKFLVSRLYKPWLHSNLIFKSMPWYPEYRKTVSFLKNFVAQTIKSTRNLGMPNNENKNADSESNDRALKSFVQLLRQSTDEQKFNETEIQEEALVLLFAGTDTTAIAISFLVMMLARNPDIQEKLYNEINEVFKGSDRPVEIEDMHKLTYLDCVMKESMRLYPPVPVIQRKIETHTTLPNGLTLVPGLNVTFNFYALHRNPKYWGSDVNLFRPERFIDGSVKNPNAFMPFSTSVRGCIGAKYSVLSQKTVIATLLRKYKILPADPLDVIPKGCDESYRPLKLTYAIMMKESNNFPIQLVNRN